MKSWHTPDRLICSRCKNENNYIYAYNDVENLQICQECIDKFEEIAGKMFQDFMKETKPFKENQE